MAKVKNKDRILKATREKQQVTYKEAPIRLSANFSAKIWKQPRCPSTDKWIKKM